MTPTERAGLKPGVAPPGVDLWLDAEGPAEVTKVVLASRGIVRHDARRC
jgi:hypothetical protein